MLIAERYQTLDELGIRSAREAAEKALREITLFLKEGERHALHALGRVLLQLVEHAPRRACLRLANRAIDRLELGG